MTPGKYLISYKDQVTDDFTNEITIDEKYGFSYVSRYTEAGMSVRELGIHHMALTGDDQQIRNIYGIIASRKMTEEIIHVEPNRPGAQYKKFFIGFKNEFMVNVVDSHAPLPEPLSRLEGELLAILDRKEIRPVKALSISADMSPKDVYPGKDVEVAIRFSNKGNWPIDVGNPANIGKKSGNTIKLDIFRKETGESGEEDLQYDFSIELEGKEYRINPRKVLPSGESTIRLKTGETVEAKVTFRFPKCAPGAYAAELIYVYDGDRENGDLLWGEYHGDPIAFQVTTRKK